MVVASNVEATIGGFVDTCATVADAVRPSEIIVVNDGSSDGTWREIAAARARHPRAGALDLAEEYGIAVAMLQGSRRA
ncbi:MAG TPA: glycosyltransferase, partial [Actinomycetota bacterium]|nr:glycosyltransferase [Actinomycetota bacterium]